MHMHMARFPPLIDTRIVRPAESALALKLVTELELLRLKTLARWYARGLPPDVTWEDLLQEAITRILVGTRQVPAGVATVAFVAGIMRSLRSEHWRRFEKAGSGDRDRATRRSRRKTELVDSAPGPERAVMAQQEILAIRSLFAQDPTALTILEGLSQGLTADEIRAAARLSETDYDSARKRMRRILLREGLTCTPK
jgi:DNA-directed RNA polymerase specialized sigma24 family protein